MDPDNGTVHSKVPRCRLSLGRFTPEMSVIKPRSRAGNLVLSCEWLAAFALPLIGVELFTPVTLCFIPEWVRARCSFIRVLLI